MELTDKELVEGCLKNDRKAQKALYDKYSAMLFGVCLRYARNRQDAEDIFQESFVKAYGQLNKYSHSGALAGWLRRLFINNALNYYRYDKSYLCSTDVESYDVGKETLNVDNYSTEEIIKAIEQLPDECRTVFNMVEIEGYSYQELSQMWNANQNTLRGFNFKAKRMLREYFEKMDKRQY